MKPATWKYYLEKFIDVFKLCYKHCHTSKWYGMLRLIQHIPIMLVLCFLPDRTIFPLPSYVILYKHGENQSNHSILSISAIYNDCKKDMKMIVNIILAKIRTLALSYLNWKIFYRQLSTFIKKKLNLIISHFHIISIWHLFFTRIVDVCRLKTKHV